MDETATSYGRELPRFSPRDEAALGVRPPTLSDLLGVLWDAASLQGVTLRPDQVPEEARGAMFSGQPDRAIGLVEEELLRVGMVLTYVRYLSPGERSTLPWTAPRLFDYANHLNKLVAAFHLDRQVWSAGRRHLLAAAVADRDDDQARDLLRAAHEAQRTSSPREANAGVTTPTDTSDDRGAAPRPRRDAPTDLETDQRQMLRELDDAAVGLNLFVLRAEVGEVVGVARSVIVLPLQVGVTVMADIGSASQEAIALGVREAVRALLPHGDSLVLAESLLTLSRSLRAHQSPLSGIGPVVRAVQCLAAIGHRKGLGRAQLELGVVLKDLGLPYEALRALERAEATCQEAEDPGGAVAVLYHRATMCRSLRLHDEAALLLDEAFERLPRSEAALTWARQLHAERVQNLMALDRPVEARRAIDAWENAAPPSGSTPESGLVREPWPPFFKAELSVRDGDVEAALDDYSNASVAAAREILTNRTARFRTGARTQLDRIFAGSLACAAAVDPGLTLGLLEVSRTDALAGYARMERRGTAPLEEWRRELEDDLAVLRDSSITAVLSGTDAQGDAPLAGLQSRAEWLIARRDLMGGAEESLPRDRQGIRALADQVCGSLPPSTVLLEFAWIGSTLFLLAATSGGVVVHGLGLSSSDVQDLHAQFERQCEKLQEPTALDVWSRELLGPVRAEIEASAELIVVPTVGLHGVPFHALSSGGAAVLDTHVVRVVPTALAATGVPRPRPGAALTSSSRCALLGTGNAAYSGTDILTGVPAELAAVSGRLQTSQRRHHATGDDLFDARDSDVLHLACHAWVETEAPLLSCLLLSDRPVFAFEIALATWRAPLVVLTACDTGRGPGFLGGRRETLASAFLAGGARSVIGAMWPLHDAVAVTCVDRLYRELMRPETTAAEALRAAQLHVRSQPRTSHPNFWAPFAAYTG